MPHAIVNRAAYRFVPLEAHTLPQLRDGLRTAAAAAGLTGTILLAPEGINCFLAGSAAALGPFWSRLTALQPFVELSFRDSYSDTSPFQQLAVKIKGEIITLGDERIAPEPDRDDRITARELRARLDDGDDLLLVDTRNDYEVAAGSFAGATDLAIASFGEFPTALERLAGNEDREVVLFCTGGIRCEKAIAVLRRQGFRRVRQLDGGILGYFASCGGAHFEGDCFVFDERVTLGSDLQPTGATLCRRCNRAVAPGDACPRCASATLAAPAS